VIYFGYSRHHSRLQHPDNQRDPANRPPHLVK